METPTAKGRETENPEFSLLAQPRVFAHTPPPFLALTGCNILSIVPTNSKGATHHEFLDTTSASCELVDVKHEVLSSPSYGSKDPGIFQF